MKTFLLLILILLNLSAKEESYCFESQNIFSHTEHTKKLILSINDWNSSKEYQQGIDIFYILGNGGLHHAEDIWCWYDKKRQIYHCNNDVTDSGNLEFDVKRQRLNIERLCTHECGVHLLSPDNEIIYVRHIIDETTEYINRISYPLGGGGDLNTMHQFKQYNDEDKKVWVQGYKCDFKRPKVIFYTIHEYTDSFPKVEEQDKLFPYFNQDMEGSDVITLSLSKPYRYIASMMHGEGFSSNWINEKDIELFIYSNNRALIKIKSSVKSLNMQSCLSGGYYFLELDNDRIKIKRVNRL